MNTLTQPLRDEHKELYPHITRIRQVAESIDELPSNQARDGVAEVYDFLANHLKPHAEAEEAALYPVVQKAMGSPDATKTMTRDHKEVGNFIEELSSLLNSLNSEPLTKVQIKSLQRVLYGVFGLVSVHFAKEEEVYLPILDQWLTPETARDMFEAMEVAAHAAKHSAKHSENQGK